MLKKLRDASILILTTSDLDKLYLEDYGFKNVCFTDNAKEAKLILKKKVFDLFIQDTDKFKRFIIPQDTWFIRQSVEIDLTKSQDFISKPTDKQELILRVIHQLRQRQKYQKLQAVNLYMSNSLKEVAHTLDLLLPQEFQLQKLSKQYKVTIDALYHPTEILGGDFYNIFPISKIKLGFYLWDFSGHGLTAAINTLRLNSAVIKYKSKYPGDFLTEMNSTIRTINSIGYFATIFYGIITTEPQKILEYAFAACPPPILLSWQHKTYKLINTNEFPLGVVDNYNFKNSVVSLADWDSIILYSDALIETQSKVNDKFLNIESLAKKLLFAFKEKPTATQIKSYIKNLFEKEYVANLKDDLTLKIITF